MDQLESNHSSLYIKSISKNSGKIQVKTPEKEFLPELFRHFFQVFFRHVQVKVEPVMLEFFR